MSYVPENPKWFIAELVVEITVEGDSRNVVHINTILIRADSSEEAYQKALELGRQSETEYVNPENKLVKTVFRGLRNLYVIHDELEHGAELWYDERIDVPQEEMAKLTVEKEHLEVFIPWQLPDRNGTPDYSPGDIMEELHKQFPHLKSNSEKNENS